jgi:hypothetical protein
MTHLFIQNVENLFQFNSDHAQHIINSAQCRRQPVFEDSIEGDFVYTYDEANTGGCQNTGKHIRFSDEEETSSADNAVLACAETVMMSDLPEPLSSSCANVLEIGTVINPCTQLKTDYSLSQKMFDLVILSPPW